mmetsp:Transcript_43285/g.48986  ORF Transcript_43285/g.48986 Transcript_43285/m.48986 type:complete len:540 (-) Transcript_43285:41-1660(-)
MRNYVRRKKEQPSQPTATAAAAAATAATIVDPSCITKHRTVLVAMLVVAVCVRIFGEFHTSTSLAYLMGDGAVVAKTEMVHHKNNDRVFDVTVTNLTINTTNTVATAVAAHDTKAALNSTTATTDLSLEANNKDSENNNNHNMTLPTCVELMMQQPESPFADRLFLTSRSTPIAWKRLSDGSAELTLPSMCRLKRYTAVEAKQCLNNKSILFVGDSLTRYQFLGLAYFLEHEEHPPRFPFLLQNCTHINKDGKPTCSTETDPNVGHNKFTHTMAGGGTDGNVFNGRMESKSVHVPYRIRDLGTVRMQYVTDSNESSIRLNLVMEVGESGKESFNGWNLTGCAYTASCRYTEEEYKANLNQLLQKQFDWKFRSITDAFDSNSNNGTTFQRQFLENIDYAFYNRGIWGQVELDTAKKMMASLYRITNGRRQPNSRSSDNDDETKCFYKSTTAAAANADKKMEREANIQWEWGPIQKATLEAGCGYFDVYHLTKDLVKPPWTQPSTQTLKDGSSPFTDPYHFQPWVYEELNNILLNTLCNGG